MSNKSDPLQVLDTEQYLLPANVTINDEVSAPFDMSEEEARDRDLSLLPALAGLTVSDRHEVMSQLAYEYNVDCGVNPNVCTSKSA